MEKMKRQQHIKIVLGVESPGTTNVHIRDGTATERTSEKAQKPRVE